MCYASNGQARVKLPFSTVFWRKFRDKGEYSYATNAYFSPPPGGGKGGGAGRLRPKYLPLHWVLEDRKT